MSEHFSHSLTQAVELEDAEKDWTCWEKHKQEEKT